MNMLKAALQLGVGAIFVACVNDNVGFTTEQLTNIGPPVWATQNLSFNAGTSETSATSFLTSNPNQPVGIFLSFNMAPAITTGIGWGVSTDLGVTWNNQRTIGFAPGVIGSISGVQMNNGNFKEWIGNNFVAALPSPDSLLLTSIAASDTGTCDVELGVSTDAGSNFLVASLISGPSNSGGTPCPSGTEVDAPTVAASTASNVAYVWWNANSTAFLRKASINTIPTPPVVTLGPVIDLSSKLPVKHPYQASLAMQYNSTTGQDDLFLVYADIFMPQSWDCTLASNQVTRTVTYWLSISHNGGSTWASKRITVDNQWPQCLTNQANGSARIRAPIATGPVYDEVLTAISRSEVDAGGHFVGTREVLFQYDGSNFESWIPVCNSAVCPPGSANCLISGTLPVGETYCNQFGASLATTNNLGSNYAGFAWHDTRDSVTPPPPVPTPSPQYLNLQVSMWGASVRTGLPMDINPTTQSRITPLGGGVPWTQVTSQSIQNTAYGDYEGMASYWGIFRPFWSDNRGGGTGSQVFTAPFGP